MENENSSFARELLGRVFSYLDPRKIAIILAVTVLAGLLGLCFGELFLKEEYRTSMTMAMVSRTSGNSGQNLSDSHHVADVMQALYDNDSVVNGTLTEMRSDRTPAQFVSNLSVKREEKTVLVKISYTDTSAKDALNGINIYSRRLCEMLNANLGYDCFEIMEPAGEPVMIDHTKTAVLIAVLIQLAIALGWVVIRVFPGVIIVTGADLNDFKEPVLGEVFTCPRIEETDENDTEGEK